MAKYSDKKWQCILDKNEERIERRRVEKHVANKRRVSIRRQSREISTPHPRIFALEERCCFKGCAFPAIWVMTDPFGASSVCRNHGYHLDWEAQTFCDLSILRVLFTSISEIKWRIKVNHLTQYTIDDSLYAQTGSRKDAISFDPVSGESRTIHKARERVARTYITTARLISKKKRSDDWRERLKEMPRNSKQEIEAIKDLKVGQSARVPAKFPDVVLSAKKMRQALGTYRATMFCRWSVKADMSGFLVVTKIEGKDGAEEYWKPATLYAELELSTVRHERAFSMSKFSDSIEIKRPEYQCAMKRFYQSADEVNVVLARMETQGQWGLCAYVCPHCDRWHIGHDSATTAPVPEWITRATASQELVAKQPEFERVFGDSGK